MGNPRELTTMGRSLRAKPSRSRYADSSDPIFQLTLPTLAAFDNGPSRSHTSVQPSFPGTEKIYLRRGSSYSTVEGLAETQRL